ncbi:MAG: hypothetical protein ACLU9S_15670 [Oscillospiraceae bacterium]
MQTHPVYRSPAYTEEMMLAEAEPWITAVFGLPGRERIKNMKNNYSVAQRNAIVVEHLWCINAVIRQNRALMRTAGLDYDDVYQQLAIRLIRAVAGFDPDKGKLEQHIFAQLKFELLNCKTPYRLCGMTGLPKDYCKEKIIPFEAIQKAATCMSRL